MLFTIDFEYDGGTYLAQVEALGPREALLGWSQQIQTTELERWGVGRAAVSAAFSDVTPVPVRGLKGVWCVTGTINEGFALANIIATEDSL